MLVANTAQEKAVNTINGPQIIISCPGSGKTTTLIRRIHHIIETGVSPSSVLMVTFSRAAAEDMRSKYQDMYGDNPGIVFATIHSLCLRILKTEGKCTNEQVLQEGEALVFLVECLREIGFSRREVWDMAVTAQNGISNVKNNFLNLSTFVCEGVPTNVFRDLYNKYDAWKEAIGKIDYDDMLLQCLDLLRTNAAVRNKYQNGFTYIQCDEYQDVNYLQRDILYILADKHKNLCVVGDDDQSIYMFRGARPEIMLNFVKDFPDASVVRMGTNYRSGQDIVASAARLIAKNSVRFDKDFLSHRGQQDGFAGFVRVARFPSHNEEIDDLIKSIKKKHKEGVAYSDMAVLFRLNRQAQHPVIALSRAGIPYYSTETVKTMYEDVLFGDVRAYITLAITGHDPNALDRVLNHPVRYLKNAAFRGCPFNERAMHQRCSYFPEQWQRRNAEKAITEWMSVLGPGKVTYADSPANVMKRFYGPGSIHYDRFLTEYAEYRNLPEEDVKAEWNDILDDAKHFHTIKEWFDFADDYITFVRNNVSRKEKGGVTLTTMHKAKGLEWNTVFVIDVNHGVVPHKRSSATSDGMAEERRLFYVAMTRAKDDLTVMSSGIESQFLSEIGLLGNKAGNSKKGSNKVASGQAGTPGIPKYFAGKPVRHALFGDGIIKRYEADQVVCDFGGVELYFDFPRAILEEEIVYPDKKTPQP